MTHVLDTRDETLGVLHRRSREHVSEGGACAAAQCVGRGALGTGYNYSPPARYTETHHS